MNSVGARPLLAFRVGVSGHRDVDENDARIGAQVDALLQAVCNGLARIAAGPGAAAYSARAGGDREYDLTLVSALAEGADRVFAAKANAFGATLYAPLPFPREVYAEDFAKRPEGFTRTLAKARYFELDGLREPAKARDESYEAVGRFTVRNCDLLIAIVDETHEHGLGGAAATAEYAARTGVPIWWIDAGDPHKQPRFIRSAAEHRNPDTVPQGEAAFQALAAWLDDTLKPPRSRDPERDGLLGYIGGLWRRGFDPDRSPLEEFYGETPPPPDELWLLYKRFMDIVAPDPGGYAPHDPEGPGPWREIYLKANQLSAAYGDRYRSSYVMVAALVIVALAGAAFSGEKSWQWVWVGAEIAGLLGIGLLVAINYARRWHERWISYRLLAELARKQLVLAPIGQSLPSADVAQLVGSTLPDDEGRAPRDAWVAWLYMAHRRACPPPLGSMATAKRAALDEGLGTVREQIKYHEGRMKRARQADLWVKRISEAFFLGTIALAFVKLHLLGDSEHKEKVHDIVFLTAAVSSVATAFVGIRAYAEFALLERHSKHMIAALKAAEQDLQALAAGPVDRPQGSLPLGRALYAITTEMMQDIKGWSHLFRVKRLEAG